MKKVETIQFKAAFLLAVFAVNIVVAFACSIGLNMGYNRHHHSNKEEKNASLAGHHHNSGTQLHQHNTPAIPSHKGTTKQSHHNTHSHGKLHSANIHPQQQSEPAQDDCCTDNAVKFQSEEKQLQQANNVIKAPVFIVVLSPFPGMEVEPITTTAGANLFAPQIFPPPDIRIAIQSFQI